MNCDTCKEKQKQAEPIPYIAYESGMARMERTNKRLWIVVIILIVALIASNIGWIAYESQFVDESWTFDAYADGDSNAIANGDGEVYFYGSESKSDAQKTNP